MQEALQSSRDAQEAESQGRIADARAHHKRAKDKFEAAARGVRELGDFETGAALDVLVAFHKARAAELRAKAAPPVVVPPAVGAAQAAQRGSAVPQPQPQPQLQQRAATAPSPRSVVSSVTQAWTHMVELGSSLLVETANAAAQQQQPGATTATTTTTTPPTTVSRATKAAPAATSSPPPASAPFAANDAAGGAMAESYFFVNPASTPTSTGGGGAASPTPTSAPTSHFPNHHTGSSGAAPPASTASTSTSSAEREARLTQDVRALSAIVKKLEKENQKLRKALAKEQEASRAQSQRFWSMFVALRQAMDAFVAEQSAVAHDPGTDHATARLASHVVQGVEAANRSASAAAKRAAAGR